MRVLPCPLQLAFPVSAASPAHEPGVLCSHSQRLLSGWSPCSPLLAAALRASRSSTGFPLPLFHLLWRGFSVFLWCACCLSFPETSLFFALPHHCPFPGCLLSNIFLSALPVISFSRVFYFWVLLSIQFTCHICLDHMHIFLFSFGGDIFSTISFTYSCLVFSSKFIQSELLGME